MKDNILPPACSGAFSSAGRHLSSHPGGFIMGGVTLHLDVLSFLLKMNRSRNVKALQGADSEDPLSDEGCLRCCSPTGQPLAFMSASEFPGKLYIFSSSCDVQRT